MPEANETVLDEAARIVHGERRDDYGSPRDSFERIAALWAPLLGVAVTAEQVALCLIQLKVARFTYGGQRDSVVDIAGYAGCLAMLRGWE